MDFMGENVGNEGGDGGAPVSSYRRYGGMEGDYDLLSRRVILPLTL